MKGGQQGLVHMETDFSPQHTPIIEDYLSERYCDAKDTDSNVRTKTESNVRANAKKLDLQVVVKMVKRTTGLSCSAV